MKSVKREPVKKGKARVPVIMQMEAMECGAAALAMVLAYYGKWIPLSSIRELCGVSRDGVKMSTIARTARIYGLEAKGHRYGYKEFFEKADFPCIIHWKFTHYIVICGYRGNKVFINDPGRGAVTITKQEFDESFTGVCLRLRPGEQFEPEGKQKSIFSYVMQYLKGSTSSLMLLGTASAIIAAAGGSASYGFPYLYGPDSKRADTRIAGDAAHCPWHYMHDPACRGLDPGGLPAETIWPSGCQRKQPLHVAYIPYACQILFPEAARRSAAK